MNLLNHVLKRLHTLLNLALIARATDSLLQFSLFFNLLQILLDVAEASR